MGLNRYNILEPCYRYQSAAEGNQTASGPLNFSMQGATDTKHFTRMHGSRNLVRFPGRDGRVPLHAELEPTYHVPCIVSDFEFDEYPY